MGKLKKGNLKVLLIAVVAVLVGSVVQSTVMAESDTAAATDQAKQATEDRSTDVDEQALKILQKATDYLTGLNQFHLKGNTAMDVVQESGQKLQFSAAVEATLKRPDRLLVSRVRDDGSTRRFWYDGKTASMYDEREKVYGKIPVPGTIDEMLDYLEEVIENPRPLADLLYSDLSPLAKLPVSGAYVGESYVGETACDHLAFRGESVDWQFWVDRGEKPLIRKVVITYKELPGGPQFTAHLDHWNVAPEISDSLFQFSPPEGAQQIRVVVLQPEKEKKGGAQ
jgi:hypothetical protein